MRTSTVLCDDADSFTFDADLFDFSLSVAKLKLIAAATTDFAEDFADDTGFTYDSAKAEFTGGLVRQKDIAIVENYSQAFAADTGFTYNATLVEFAAGVARQKNQRPAGATCCAKFDIDKNFNWADGSITGTLTGDASVSNGKVDLRGAGGWFFNGGDGNANAGLNSGETICYRLHYFPGYTGAPSSNQIIMEQAATGNKNSIFITHRTANDFSISVYDSSGVEHAFFTSTVSMVADTEYVLELNIDFAGTTRFYVNGILKGSLNTSSWTRSNEFISTCYFNRGDSANGNFQLGDVILFNDVQHTTDHSGSLPYSYPSYVYLESVIVCPIMSYLYNIASFGAPTATEVNAPKYIVNGYYWNGAAWAASSNTYATAMTLAQWQTNIATFPSGQFGSGVVVKTVFQGSNTLSSIDNIAFDINEIHYLETKVTCPTYTYSGPGSILSIGTPTSTEVGSVRWIVDDQYWNGSAFAASDGSYAQATSKADWIAHLSAFVLSGNDIVVEPVFPTGNTQCSVANMTFTVTGQEYPQTEPTIKLAGTHGLDALYSFSELTATIPGSDAIKILLWISGVRKYWNGTAWITANGTYAQTNTAAEITANADTLDLSLGATITFEFFFLSEDGTTTPELTSFTYAYDFFATTPTAPEECSVYLHVKDIVGEDIVGEDVESATLTATLTKSFILDGWLIAACTKSADLNANGYVDLSLVESETAGKRYNFVLTYTCGGTEYVTTFRAAQVPADTTEVDLLDITSVAS